MPDFCANAPDMATHLLSPGAFRGQTALVTGKGTGLGFEVSSRLGRLGARVVCASRNAEHHRTLIERGKAEGFNVDSVVLDVRDPKQVRRVVREVAARCGGSTY